MPAIHHSNCPVCNSENLVMIFSVKDHSVSGSPFFILECQACTLRFTQDVPDENSIGDYYRSENYISHTNTSKGLINGLYQRVRKRTLKQKRKLIQKLTQTEKGYLLDIGSGTGAFAHEMIRNGWEVTAIEPDEIARRKAKEDFGVELQDMKSFFDLPSSAFDAISLWHVLEHVHQLHKYVDRLHHLLKPQGKLFIAVPNYTSKDAEIYKEYWAAYDVPRHLYHFSPNAMQVLMEKHGLKIEKHLPMWFDSFYVSMLSSKYKKGATRLLGAFSQGLSSNLKAMKDVKKCSSIIYVISK